jgi:hypothetical protein
MSSHPINPVLFEDWLSAVLYNAFGLSFRFLCTWLSKDDKELIFFSVRTHS